MSDHHTRHADKGAQTLKSDALLLITAGIWGFAFVAQRVGMDYVGPFGFNGVRFALGCLVLLPFLARNGLNDGGSLPAAPGVFTLRGLGGGLVAGLVLFTGASFQQVAMIYTTAGNAGFITGLYVIPVPIIGLFLGHRTHAGPWIGAVMATAGLFLPSASSSFTIPWGALPLRLGYRIGADHDVGSESFREFPHAGDHVLTSRIDNQIRVESRCEFPTPLAALGDDGSGAVHLGHRDVQATDRPGSQDHNGVSLAGAGPVMRCQYGTARFRQGRVCKAQSFGHGIDDAILQDLGRQRHPLGEAAWKARRNPQELQVVAKIVSLAPAVIALAAVHVRCNRQTIAHVETSASHIDRNDHVNSHDLNLVFRHVLRQQTIEKQ